MKALRILIQIVICLALLAAGVLGFQALTKGKKAISEKKADVVLPMVRIMQANPSPVMMRVSAEGSVVPLQKTILSVMVNGTVDFIASSLVEGGSFKKGQLLLSIDSVDYELALTLSRSKVKEAETNLQTRKEEAAVALYEWQTLHGKKKDDIPALVAKKPQLAEAEAALLGAKASLAQSELNLKRCKIYAPFDGMVISKNVDIGQYVSPGVKVAEIFSTHAVEIPVWLEDDDLAWIKVPGLNTPKSKPGSKVIVKTEFAGSASSWPGEVVRSQAQVDLKTRMVPVIVRVKNPYAKLPPLALGMFCSLDFLGITLNQAVRLPRSALKSNNTVWVVAKDDSIEFRKVTAVRKQNNAVIITAGLKKGERVVVSNLRAVSRGMKVRVAAEAEK